MTDSIPLVCVFFQLPPSEQLFLRIHDIPWFVLLPQLERLTNALGTFLVSNPSPEAMEALLEARKVMATKIRPLHDVMLTTWDFSKHYVEFVDRVSQDRMSHPLVNESFEVIAEQAVKKVEKAQKALSEFQEELEKVIVRIPGLVGADNNHVSLFITESSEIASVMVPAIEECNTLLQECIESFTKIRNQDFDPESFKRNPPSDAEFQLVREKWESLENFSQNIGDDWPLLRGRIGSPHLNRVDGEMTTSDVQNAAALTGISEDAQIPEVPPDIPPPAKVKVPFWKKVILRFSSCFSSKPFC